MNSYLPPPNFLAEEKSSIATHVCSLRFRDGAVATARIQARSSYQTCPVVYSGAVERLPIRDRTADAVMLRVLFQSFARELQAKFEEHLIESLKQSGEEDGANTP